TVAVGDVVALDGRASQRAETFAWSFATRPAGSTALLDPTDEPLSAFVADAAGTYTVRLTVGDGLRQDSDTLTVEALPPASTLLPEGLHLGEGGVVLAALPGTLDAAIGVFASVTAAPGAPLPAGVELVGSAHRIGSAEGAYGGANPFVVALPVPDGVDVTRLALVHEVRPEDVTGTYLTEQTWELLGGVFEPDERYFLTTLARLAAGGRVVALVTGERLRSERAARSVVPAVSIRDHDVAFAVSCVDFDVPTVNNRNLTCGDDDEADLEAVLATAYHDFVGLGFPEPYLRRDVEAAGTALDLDAGTVDVALGPFVAELRPFRDVASGGSRWPCGTADGITNLGGYATGSQSFFVCIGPNGVLDATGHPTGAVDTARHEYFHATQYAYPGVRSRSTDLWVIEGTAVASERSLATMARANRPWRPVDVPLTASGDDGLVHYRAQDFFVFAGRELGLGLGYLRSVFEHGGRTSDVDAGLRDLGFAGGLSEMFVRWTRDQATVALPPAFGGGCLLAADVATPVALPRGASSPTTSVSGAVPSLSAEVVRVDFAAHPAATYPARLRLAAPVPAGVQVRVLDGAGCWRRADLTPLDEFLVEVPVGRAWSTIVVIANTTVDAAAADLGYALEVVVDPAVGIASPPRRSSQFAGDALELRATITGSDAAVAALPIEWIVASTGPTPHLTFTSVSDETLLAARHDPYCSLTYDIEASVDASTFSTAYGRLVDRLQIDLRGRTPESLRVVITAPQRQVQHLELRESAPGVFDLSPFTLRGFAAQRRCGADGQPDATARWRDFSGRELAVAPFQVSHLVEPAAFDDGRGGWSSRWFYLEASQPGSLTARRSVLLAPCLGREGDGLARPSGVPPCPAEIDGFFYDLEEAFATLARLPSLQELAFALDGPTRDLEDAFGLGGGGFPIRDDTVLPSLDVDGAVLALLADLRGVVAVRTLADAELRLRELDDRVRADRELDGIDLTLFWIAHGLVWDTLHAFKAEAEAASDVDGAPAGGAWSRPRFVRDTDPALGGIDAVAPARGALQGFLTSANYGAPTHPIHLRAATLGALVYAAEELERAGY
ncbi:MAG: hypothetical protein K0A98_06100, partial [Trueperaceae bacterium]|nr:hypothetical protein [Trueperaceae bacterium]